MDAFKPSPAGVARNYCGRCGLARLCLCAEMPIVATTCDFLVVRHVREIHKPSNTARLAAAALPRCHVFDYGVLDRPFDDGPLRVDAWLLFPPERDGHGTETGRHRTVTRDDAPHPRAFVVLDGTWGQARRMSHRIPALETMPRFVLPAPAIAPPRLRQGPVPEALATIEAIARVVEIFDGPVPARVLDSLHTEFVRRSRVERGQRGLPARREFSEGVTGHP
jgi:DTW domain-containing protein YfiP